MIATNVPAETIIKPNKVRFGSQAEILILEQIWSGLPQIADIDCSSKDFSVGPYADIEQAGSDLLSQFEPVKLRSSLVEHKLGACVVVGTGSRVSGLGGRAPA